MRHTLQKNLWAKLQNLLTKTNDQDLRAKLADIRVTIAPNGDAILWDPTKELLVGVMNHLARERTFVRKSSASLPVYNAQIDKLIALTGQQPTFTGGYDGAQSGQVEAKA